jgi:hypothetical protein
MSAPELCPAHRYGRPEDPEERVICMLEEHIPGAWGFICSGCWQAMLNAKARHAPSCMGLVGMYYVFRHSPTL